MRASSNSPAFVPISRLGTATVVSVGVRCDDSSKSPKPVTASSPGTETPRRAHSSTAPAANTSLANMSASVSGCSRSAASSRSRPVSRSTAATPESTTRTVSPGYSSATDASKLARLAAARKSPDWNEPANVGCAYPLPCTYSTSARIASSLEKPMRLSTGFSLESHASTTGMPDARSSVAAASVCWAPTMNMPSGRRPRKARTSSSSCSGLYPVVPMKSW